MSEFSVREDKCSSLLAEGCFSMPGHLLVPALSPTRMGLVGKDFSPSTACSTRHTTDSRGDPRPPPSASIEQHGSIGAKSIYISRGTSPRPSPPSLGRSDQRQAPNQRQRQGPRSEGKSCKTPGHLQYSCCNTAQPRLELPG